MAVAAAYRSGYELPDDIYSDDGATFESTEATIRRNYEDSGASMPWENARPASMDAFDRIRHNRLQKHDKDTR